jgi:hypothetical protein
MFMQYKMFYITIVIWVLKGKAVPQHTMEAQEERSYNS